jgi:L-asparaginase II
VPGTGPGLTLPGMGKPISVTVRRGSVVEAVHRIHAVAVQDGAVVAEAGDSGLVAFLRSSSKPLQAVPLARARENLEESDLAIAAASHPGDPPHVEAVRSLLAKAPARESDLECGPQDGRPPEPIFHNCSGKHAGMLALARTRGWPTDGYRLAGHPVQAAMLEIHAEAARVEENEIPTAVDGCGVVTFALTLERAALAFSRLGRLDGGGRVAAAMRARPELIGGRAGADVALMQALSGWVAKSGAEGLLCAAGPDGLGIALKSEDGSQRALKPALAAFLTPLQISLAQFERVQVRNSRGEEVGEIAVA